jgi:hypothetical protein
LKRGKLKRKSEASPSLASLPWRMGSLEGNFEARKREKQQDSSTI